MYAATQPGAKTPARRQTPKKMVKRASAESEEAAEAVRQGRAAGL